MKKLFLLSLPLLAACSPLAAEQKTLDDFLQNPLYADRYYEDLAIHMADFIIQKDPLTEDAEMNAAIDEQRLAAMAKGEEIDAIIKGGIVGGFMSERDETWGRTLLLGNTLYFSPDFIVAPGIDLHVYLSESPDPRFPSFPDPTAVDLGPLVSAFSSHTIEIPADVNADGMMQSVVLYDKTLKRIYGFSVMGPN